jgi:mRNA interferase RelE/StbE
MFEIILFNPAGKFYDRLDDKLKAKVTTAIEGLKNNPFRGKDIKKLKGKLEENYRLRIGDIRVVYQIDKEASLIIIKAMGRREGIY